MNPSPQLGWVNQATTLKMRTEGPGKECRCLTERFQHLGLWEEICVCIMLSSHKGAESLEETKKLPWLEKSTLLSLRGCKEWVESVSTFSSGSAVVGGGDGSRYVTSLAVCGFCVLPNHLQTPCYVFAWCDYTSVICNYKRLIRMKSG